MQYYYYYYTHTCTHAHTHAHKHARTHKLQTSDFIRLKIHISNTIIIINTVLTALKSIIIFFVTDHNEFLSSNHAAPDDLGEMVST